MKIIFIRIVEEVIRLGVRHRNGVSWLKEVLGLKVILVGEETIDFPSVVLSYQKCLKYHEHVLSRIYALKELLKCLDDVGLIGLVVLLIINQVPAAFIDLTEAFEVILRDLFEFCLQQSLLLLIENLGRE